MNKFIDISERIIRSNEWNGIHYYLETLLFLQLIVNDCGKHNMKNKMNLNYFGILFIACLFLSKCNDINKEDAAWLNTTSDIVDLSNVCICVWDLIINRKD